MPPCSRVTEGSNAHCDERRPIRRICDFRLQSFPERNARALAPSLLQRRDRYDTWTYLGGLHRNAPERLWMPRSRDAVWAAPSAYVDVLEYLSQHMDEDEAALREKARAAIRSGKLPALRRPDRAWSGHGVGAPCAVCQLPIQRYDLEFEIQFEHDGAPPELDRFQLHLRCFAVWELERHAGQE
jgi:hypothetical protein